MKNSLPCRTLPRILRGVFSQIQPQTKALTGNNINTRTTAGTWVSRIGASHRAARKPRTTDGREAMISMVGFTYFFQDGFKNSAVYNAASNAIGTAKINA